MLINVPLAKTSRTGDPHRFISESDDSLLLLLITACIVLEIRFSVAVLNNCKGNGHFSIMQILCECPVLRELFNGVEMMFVWMFGSS